jgi:hypothetical protein
MDNFDIPAFADRSVVYVSFSEKVPVESYVRHYLSDRQLGAVPSALAEAREWILKMPGTGPLYKADVDYFLDKNVFQLASSPRKRRPA